MIANFLDPYCPLVQNEYTVVSPLRLQYVTYFRLQYVHFLNYLVNLRLRISHLFHVINTVIDALSWISINVYLTQCMHSIYFIIKIEVHCTVSDKDICSVGLIRQLYLRILSALNLN